ncbi:MAG: glycine zipper 2TM domain-containing protein [Burkholderiales bacterium]|nr:glycine zipper 2TM domain-containing protein [Burkholderiales bacterium]
MKRRQLFAGLAAAAVLAASGCANMTPEQKQLTGQIAGGVTGAAVGSLFGGGTGRVVATGAGAVLGTVVGGKIASP